MSNAFKSNSRFAALAEETNINNVFNKKDKNSRNKQRDGNETKNDETKNNEPKKEGNRFTSEGFNSFNSYDSRHRRPVSDFESIKSKELREKKEKNRQDELKKINEKEKEKALAIENFPDLVTNNKKTENKTPVLQTGFMDKVKIVKDVKPVATINEKISNIKPGWIEITRDPITKKIITTRNPISGSDYNYDSDNSDDNDINVLNALVALHKKRTKEYIEQWGYDTWEKMFRFPNYDYEYFNKLDEQYEEEMEKWREENEKDSDSEDYY
jgi:hypothetical protein